MTNYRELFGRLVKCNRPAGVSVYVGYCAQVFHGSKVSEVAYWDRPHECRAALMLIVDALEASDEHWYFSRRKDFEMEEYQCRLWRCLSTEREPYTEEYWGCDPDQVTAIAECLIAALGVAE